MRTRMLTVAAATAITLGAGASAQAQTPAAGTLYLQQAAGGTLKGDTLTLRGINARTTTFQDRPQRSGGSLTTRSFASGFGTTFGSDPPNAALEIDGAPASRDVVLLELRSPRYDARRRTLTYTVKRLPRTDAKGLAAVAARADSGSATSFGRASLFIDDGTTATPVLFGVTAPPGGTVTITLSGATFDYDSFGVTHTNIGTPPTSTGQIDYGEGQMNASTMTFNAALGGNGLSIYTITGVDATGASFAGTATIPAGATAFIQPVGGTLVNLTGGAFTVPLPAS